MSNSRKKSNSNSVKHFASNFLDYSRMYSKPEELLEHIKKYTLITVISIFVLTFVIFIFPFVIVSPIDSVIIKILRFHLGYCCILSTFIILYQCHIFYIWKKTGSYNRDGLLYKVLFLLLIIPMWLMTIIVNVFSLITNTTNIKEYANEVLVSDLYAVNIAGIFVIALTNIITDNIDELIMKISVINTGTICAYYMLLLLAIFKVARNRLLLHFVKKSSKSAELGNERCHSMHRQLTLELDTIGLILILCLTVIFTPLSFKSGTEKAYLCASLQYLCVVSSAHIALKSHIKEKAYPS